VARVFGAKLAEMWGQQVVVENKPGAAGSTLAEQLSDDGLASDDEHIP